MSSPRVRHFHACAAALLATAALAGCFGNRYAAENTGTVRLQGVWRLNRAASEDPQPIIDKLKEEALKKIRRAMNAQQAGSFGGPGGGQGGGQRRRGQGGVAKVGPATSSRKTCHRPRGRAWTRCVIHRPCTSCAPCSSAATS